MKDVKMALLKHRYDYHFELPRCVRNPSGVHVALYLGPFIALLDFLVYAVEESLD